MKKNKGGRPPTTIRKRIDATTPRAEIEKFIKEKLRGGITGYMTKLLDDIEKVESESVRAKLKLEFLNYFMPKLKSVELSGEVDTTQPIQIVFAQAGQPQRLEQASSQHQLNSLSETIVDAAIEEDDEEEEEEEEQSEEEDS